MARIVQRELFLDECSPAFCAWRSSHSAVSRKRRDLIASENRNWIVVAAAMERAFVHWDP